MPDSLPTAVNCKVEELRAAIGGALHRCTGFDLASITSETRLVHDAGLAGDDFDEFFDWFGEAFDISMRAVNIFPFRPPEVAPMSFHLWPFKRRLQRYIPLTVEDLVDVARAGSWDMPGPGREFAARDPVSIHDKRSLWIRLVFD